MKILEKLKLALLATSVMVFPKGGQAADQEKEPAKTLTRFRPGPAKPEDEKPIFTSIIPAGPSNQPSKPIALSPFVRPAGIIFDSAREVFDSIFPHSRYRSLSFSPSKQVHLKGTIDQAELQMRKIAIGRLIEKLRCDNMIDESTTSSQGISNLIIQAFELSAADIEKRSLPILKMVDQLFPNRSDQNRTDLLFVFGQSSASFIEELLKLNENQIEHRTNRIKENNDFLLFDKGVRFNTAPFHHQSAFNSRIKRLSSLFKLHTEEIVERALIMKTYFNDQLSYVRSLENRTRNAFYPDSWNFLDSITHAYIDVLQNGSLLGNSALKSRLDLLKSQINALKSLAGVNDESETLNEIIIPPEFSAYAAGLQINDEDLANRFRAFIGLKELFTPEKKPEFRPRHSVNFKAFLHSYTALISIPSNDLSARVAAVRKYQDYLEGPEKIKNLLLTKTSAQIYDQAEKTHFSRYVSLKLIPAIAQKFRENNKGTTLTDEGIARAMQITNYYTPVGVENSIATFGTDYKALFQYVPLEPLLPHLEPSPSQSLTPAAPSSSMHSSALQGPESSSLSVARAPRTFRTTGANPNARTKHSAIAIKLPNRELQDTAYQLIINHRTRGSGLGPVVRIFNPSTRTYINLGTLPSSPSGFHETSFDLSSWVQAVCNDSSLESVIATYVSFKDGVSDIHSFKIQSREGKNLKEVVFGDKKSESQSGVHVYAPETDQDANEWSTIHQ